MMVQRIPGELFARRFHLYGADRPAIKAPELVAFRIEGGSALSSEARLVPYL